MSTKRLTSAQRWAFFVMGAFGTTFRRGTSGKRIRFDCCRAIEKAGFVEFVVNVAKYRLTTAGRPRFEAEFGQPCPAHGWLSAVDWFEGEYRRCDICRAVHSRVCGREMTAALLPWERNTLAAVAKGDQNYFVDNVDSDQRQRARHRLVRDGLIEMDSVSLTPLGRELLDATDLKGTIARVSLREGQDVTSRYEGGVCSLCGGDALACATRHAIGRSCA